MQQVLDAVDTLHPAIEIPDSRFADFVGAGAAQIIADNACAHLFVLGPPTTSDWRALDLVEERPIITMRGQQFIGHGKNVLGDPRLALTWLANELRQLGITLKAGRIVTTGTCHPPLPIQSGDFSRRISACSAKCRWGSSRSIPVIASHRVVRHAPERQAPRSNPSRHSRRMDCFVA